MRRRAQPDAAEPQHTQAYAGVRDAEVADTQALVGPATLAATRGYSYTELFDIQRGLVTIYRGLVSKYRRLVSIRQPLATYMLLTPEALRGRVGRVRRVVRKVRAACSSICYTQV